MATETAKNCRRVFFLSEGLKKQGLRGNEKPVFQRVHVIGAGVMGGDIAAWCALRGMAVTLQDLDMERIKPALDRAKSLFKKRLEGTDRSGSPRWRGSRRIVTGKGIGAGRCDHRGGGREPRDQAQDLRRRRGQERGRRDPCDQHLVDRARADRERRCRIRRG